MARSAARAGRTAASPEPGPAAAIPVSHAGTPADAIDRCLDTASRCLDALGKRPEAPNEDGSREMGGALGRFARVRSPVDVIPAGIGRGSGPRGAGGNGWDPGPPARPAMIREPTRRRAGCPRQPGEGRGTSLQGGRPEWDPAGTPGAPGPARVTGRPGHGGHDPPARRHPRRCAAGPGRTARFPRAEKILPRPRGRAAARERAGAGQAPGPGRTGRWGTLQGGLGVCIIVASAAVGAIVTMVHPEAPGILLGLLIVAGTVAASLAVRPRAGR